MSRHDGYPGWSSLPGVVALLVLAYLLTCALMVFNVPWMIRNWNRDFLAEQPPCSAKEQK